MKKELILSALMLSAMGAANAQAVSPSGSVNGIIKVTASVPQLCNIKSADFLAIPFGEYIGQAKTIAVNMFLDCKANTKVTLGIENGANPQSVLTERRLPLDGVAGDVPHYLSYRITSDNAGTKNIGTGADAYSVTKSSTSSSALVFTYYGQLNAKQPAAVVGNYSEDLNATLDYE